MHRFYINGQDAAIETNFFHNNEIITLIQIFCVLNIYTHLFSQQTLIIP